MRPRDWPASPLSLGIVLARVASALAVAAGTTALVGVMVMSTASNANMTPPGAPIDSADRIRNTERLVMRHGLSVAEMASISGVFSRGVVEPGETLGPVTLGEPLATLLEALPTASSIYEMADETHVWRRYVYSLEMYEVSVRLDMTLGLIESADISIANCADQVYRQDRELFPELDGGLTIGTHASRLHHRFGAPLTVVPSADGMSRAMVYHGFSVEVCRQHDLVSGIRVFAAGPEALSKKAAQPPQAIERVLALTNRDRREIQVRLRIAGLSPGSVDGVFGPSTRQAIVDWQRDERLPPTGYLDAAGLAHLRTMTESGYQSALRRKAMAARRSDAPVSSAVPNPRPSRRRNSDGCARSSSGTILTGRGLRCDLQFLREDLAGILF